MLYTATHEQNEAGSRRIFGREASTLELYTQQGRISVTYQKGKRGQVATYDEAELERLKAELSAPAYPQRGALVPEQSANARMRAIAPIPPPEAAQAFGLQLATAISDSLQDRQGAVPVADKLTLSLKEAAQLTGLSRNFLLQDFNAGRLKAAKRGRAWNIKRTDLEKYI